MSGQRWMEGSKNREGPIGLNTRSILLALACIVAASVALLAVVRYVFF